MPKLDLGDIDFFNKDWKVGWNIGRAIRFMAAPQANFTAYRVVLSNLHGKLLLLQFLVPANKPPHMLLTDLKHLSDGTKPWFAVKFKWENDLPMIENIITIDESEITQEELDQKSLALRGGSVKIV